MSTLSQAIDQYLELRRGLGTRFLGVHGVFRSFANFADREHATHVTTDLVLRWAQEQSGVSQATRAARFLLVRGFAVWRSATDARTEVPPKGVLPGRYKRKKPYIYTDREIEQLIQAARRLPPSTALKGHTYATIFALLSVTGMRVSEALAIDRDDVMLDQAIIRIRHTKFDKSRLVPIHQSTCDALGEYAQQRQRLIQSPLDAAFFLSDRRIRVTGCAVRYNFARISQRIGLRVPADKRRHGSGPRLHDFRHRFAVCTLVDWYRAGADVERQMPKLSAYLGHAHLNDTYWYIEAVPDLLELATQRLQQNAIEVKP